MPELPHVLEESDESVADGDLDPEAEKPEDPEGDDGDNTEAERQEPPK